MKFQKRSKSLCPTEQLNHFGPVKYGFVNIELFFTVLWVIILNLSTKSFKAFWTSLKISMSSPETVFVMAPIYDLRKREHIQKGQTPNQ